MASFPLDPQVRRALWFRRPGTCKPTCRTQWRSDWTPVALLVALLCMLIMLALLLPSNARVEKAKQAADDKGGSHHPPVVHAITEP